MRQGIIMEIQAKNAFVFTNDCSLIQVVARKDMFVGQSIQLPEAPAAAVRLRRWLAPALAAACLVLLLCLGLLMSVVFLPQAGTVYLSLDINPSVEFTLDARRIVTDVQPMNSDAWELLRKAALTGLTYEEAISRWVALVRENYPGKLDQLLISAILSRRDRSFADTLMTLNGSQAGERLGELKGLDVRVLFATNHEIKDEAAANGLSIGRQMLLNRARDRQLALDAEAVRKSPLRDLIQILLNDPTGQTTAAGPTTSQVQLTETLPTATQPAATTADAAETSQTAGPSASETSAATVPATQETIQATTMATTQATTKATTKATNKAPTPTPAGMQLTAASNSDGWLLKWTASPVSKPLAYYKVVISKSISQPKYPDNGYLYAITDRTANQCQVTNSSKYNGGDFGGYLTVGQKYYVSVTYVYKDSSKQYSSVLHLLYNGPAYVAPTTVPTAAFNPVLSASSDAEGIHLNWTISPEDRCLNYYKVVVSPTVTAPKYPDNGYLFAIGDRSDTTRLINNGNPYNGGDFGSYLTAGQKYYISVTYVFDGSKAYSTVQEMTYNGPAGP